MVTNEQLEAFRVVAENISQAYTRANFPTLPLPVLTIEVGKRYARIVRSEGTSSRSVHCFVDLESGDILKAASWKVPAKHVRANLNDADVGASGVGPHGAMYLR